MAEANLRRATGALLLSAVCLVVVLALVDEPINSLVHEEAMAPHSPQGAALLQQQADTTEKAAAKSAAKLAGREKAYKAYQARKLAVKEKAHKEAEQKNKTKKNEKKKQVAIPRATKRMLHDMKKNVKKWQKRAKKAGHQKKFTRLQVRDSYRTAHAAREAWDAERGAAAISGVAKTHLVYMKDAADAIWEKAVANARALGAKVHGPHWYHEKNQKMRKKKLLAKYKSAPKVKVLKMKAPKKKKAKKKKEKHVILKKKSDTKSKMHRENRKSEKKLETTVTKDMYKTYVDPYQEPKKTSKRAATKRARELSARSQDKDTSNVAKIHAHQKRLAKKLKKTANYFIHRGDTSDTAKDKAASDTAKDKAASKQLAEQDKQKQEKTKLEMRDIKKAMVEEAKAAITKAAKKAAAAGISAGAQHSHASGAARKAVRKAASSLKGLGLK